VASGSVEFSNEQIDVICAFEQTYWQTGKLPTNEKVSELTGVAVKTIEGYFKLDHFRNALLTRGIDLNPSRSEALLTLPQLELANRLLNVHDTRSVREKLQEAGVTSQQYHSWMRKPAFSAYLAQRAKDMFEASDHEAYNALVGAVRSGDMRAITLFFEMRNIYNPKMQIEVNIDVVLVRVVEIIARHVRDPQTLQAIADELEMLEIGTGTAPNGQTKGIPMPILDIPGDTVMEKEFVL
jgi:hypothetical protein